MAAMNAVQLDSEILVDRGRGWQASNDRHFSKPNFFKKIADSDNAGSRTISVHRRRALQT